MIDPFGRTISYLRVSVTDRCDFRCVYCMAEDMTFLPKAEILSLEELDRVCSAFVRLGVRKLRLTGGEPLVRKNVMSLFRALGRHLETGALDELTLTTNGSGTVASVSAGATWRSLGTGDLTLSGDVSNTGTINFNANAGTQANAFNGGHNLHKLTLSATNAYTIPVFPPSCF